MTQIGEPERQRLAQIAELYYKKRKSQPEIARQLGTSQSEVSRSLNLARQLGIVSIEVHHDEQIEGPSDLRQEFPHVREVILLPATAAEEHEPNRIDELAAVCAQYFVERTPTGATLGLSCGTTVRAFVRAVTGLPSGVLPRGCSVHPLTVTARNEIVTIDPTTLVASLVAALPDSRASTYRLDEEGVRDKIASGAANLNTYIIGIGCIDFEGRKRQAPSVSHEFNALIWKSGVVQALRDLNAAGECLYQPLTDRGESLMDHLELAKFAEEVAYLPLDVLREHVEGGTADVIAIAGGRHKAGAIRAALEGRLFNVLVTDPATLTATRSATARAAA